MNYEKALRELVEAARSMPRATLTGGACSDADTYRIEHGIVWTLDNALRRAEQLIGKS